MKFRIDIAVLLKAISWRCIATLTTILISYAITHKVDAALSIGGIEFVLKIGVFYFHEKIWSFILKVFPNSYKRHEA